MQLIKPMKQGAVYKVYEYMRRYYLNVGVLSAFYFDGGGELCTEQHMWERISKEYGNLPLDYCMPKPSGEVLVRGHAYAPEGTNVTGREVWVKIGGVSRKLYAIGNRFWRDSGITGKKASDPQPFSRLSLGWENAYGGSTFAYNPLGKGHEPVEVEPGNMVHMLPNLLDPANPEIQPGDDVRPVSFDAIPYEWPQRMSLAGNYDGDWKEKYFPGFAPDIDWRIFNTAQEEQRLEKGFFTGDEAFELGGMHPSQEIIRGKLPGVRSRVFLNFTGRPVVNEGEPERFVEVDTHLDTVTFFPDLGMGVICWRGVCEAYSEDSLEVGQILVAYEKLTDQPRSIEHYKNENEARRFKPGRLPTALLNEVPLIPLGARSGFTDMLEEAKKFSVSPIFENAKRRVDDAMKDIDRFVEISGTGEQVEKAFAEVPMPPDLSPDKLHEADIDGYVKRMQEYADKKSAERDEALDMMSKVMGDKMLTEPTPLFKGDDAVRGLGVFEGMRGKPGMEEMDKVPEPEVMTERFKELEGLSRLDERMHGYLKPRFRLRKKEEQDYLRARLLDDIKRGNSLVEKEFSACDFSGFDFSGLDMRGVDMRSCIFKGCNFEGADLRRAVMSHSNFTEANCRNVNALECGLSGADLRGACFAGADLGRAGLGGSNLRGGDFAGAKFEGTQVMDADWSGADFSGANLKSLSAIRSNFRKAKFYGAEMSMCNFVECQMDSCDFNGAKLFRLSFVQQCMDNSQFREAKMHRVIFSNILAGSLEKCDFAGADMDVVNLQDNDLRGTNFKHAKMVNCSFMNSDMRSCCLRGTNVLQSTFRRSNLENSDFSAANLARASLRMARLVRTDFTGSNLIEADLLRCQLGETIFRGADLRRTIMQDWKPGEDYVARGGEE